QAESMASIVLMFDSTGKMIRYAERRGPPIRPMSGGRATAAEVDAAARAARSTVITLDFGQRRATIVNRGGGMPDQMTAGAVDAVESMDKFGTPLERATRILEQCAGK